MALMSFREPNQVKWRGVRPAHRGTQVAKSSVANNATVILHTVSPGKVLYISAYWCSLTVTAGINSGRMSVRNDADVLQYYLFNSSTAATAFTTLGLSPYPPIEVPSGWDICLISDAAVVFAHGGVFGWEE